MKKIPIIIIIIITVITVIIFTPSVYSLTTITKTPIDGDTTHINIPLSSTSDNIYNIKNGSLTISGDIPGLTNNNVGVIFVEKDLFINPSSSQIVRTVGNAGLVFIVKGNVYIAPTVTRVDAVIISQGTIYTAATDSPCSTSQVSESSPGVLIQPLTINGSLIALNDTLPIKFCRSLADNTQPAEIINHQVKYLVILRNLISDTWQKWSEIP